MADPIGALRVDLSANAAQFEKDMGRARNATRKSTRAMSKSIGDFRSSVASTIKSIFSLRSALIAVAGVSALGILIKRNIEAADAIAKTADKIGIGVEALQELRFAAELTGVATGTLDMALQRFSRRFGEAAAGTGELKGVLEEYGIATRNADGNTKSLDQALSEYADTIKNAENNQERLRLAFKGFDSEGAALVNTLRGGSEALDRMRQEARDLGLVLGEDMVRDAERANDELTRMFRVLQTQLTRVVVGLSPEIVRLGEAFAAVVPQIVEFANQFVPDKFLPAEALKQRINEIESEIQRLTNLPRLSFERLLKGDIFENLSGDLPEKVREEIAELAAERDKLNAIIAERIRKESMLSTALENSSGANQTLATTLADLRADLQFEIDQLGRTAKEQELYNLAKQAGVEVNDEFRSSIGPLVSELQFLKDAHKAVEEAAKIEAKRREELARKGKQITKELRTDQEAYNARVEELSKLHQAGAIDADTYARGLKKAKDELDDVADATKKNEEFARDLGLTFTSAFEDAVIAGGDLSDVLRGLEQDLLRIAIRKTVTEPLGNLFSSALKGILPFVHGGMHTGGLRLVGERGPEIEATGPARYYSAGRSADMLRGDGGPSGGNVEVNVYAPPGSTTETRESAGPGGRTIDVIIDETNARLIGTPGSRTGRALRQNFTGVQPQLKGRG